MGTIKKGASNRYLVLSNVLETDMPTALANLGNSVVFYSKASTAGGTASTQAYANNNQFPTLTALTAGMIVQIGWTAAEVQVAVLGEANVASGGSTGPLVNIPVTAGQTVLTITGKQVSAITAILRGGDTLTPTTHYTLSQSSNNVSVTLSNGVQPVQLEEASTLTSFQYQ